ncbi:MAG: TolC family protein [Sphaerochaetaceae bacterium]|nr:TolC family protein [Sphaerochaetaceae bacterium]
MDPLIYSTGITLTQPIFTWGKRSHALKLSQAMVLVKRNQLQNQNRTLFSELETRMASVTHLKAILALLQQQEQLAQELVSLTQQASQSGMLLALEVGETRLQVQQITMAKLEIQHAIETQILELQRLSGRKDVSAIDIFQSYDKEALTAFLETPVSALVGKALAADQPALMAITTLEQVTAEAEKIARGSFYGKPDLALVIQATYSGPKMPLFEENWQKENDYNFNVSVGFKTTLWDGGKILNEIRRAASQSESARIQTQSVRQQIEQKVRENHLKLTMTVEKLQNQQEKTETLTQRKLLNAQLAEAGLQGRQQTLIAEIEVLASQIEEEQLKINLSQYITILKALT